MVRWKLKSILIINTCFLAGEICFNFYVIQKDISPKNKCHQEIIDEDKLKDELLIAGEIIEK